MASVTALARALLFAALAPSPAFFGAACGGAPQAAPASPLAQDVASIQASLVAGPWRLVDYRPDLSLEPMLQALLAQQVRSMIVRFDGRVMSARSPTIQIARPYSIENAAGLAFDLVAPDPQGSGPMSSRCQMSADGMQIAFRAQSDPWPGTGLLRREGP